jgi:hypothetical protein
MGNLFRHMLNIGSKAPTPSEQLREHIEKLQKETELRKMLAASNAAQTPPDPEIEAAMRAAAKEAERTQYLERMNRQLDTNKQLMRQAVQQLSDVLKGFSPTALAKVIARDPEIEDLITKALFLSHAFKPEKPRDPSQ